MLVFGPSEKTGRSFIKIIFHRTDGLDFFACTNIITKLHLCKLGTVKLLHNFKSTVWSSHTNSTFIPCR